MNWLWTFQISITTFYWKYVCKFRYIYIGLLISILAVAFGSLPINKFNILSMKFDFFLSPVHFFLYFFYFIVSWIHVTCRILSFFVLCSALHVNSFRRWECYECRLNREGVCQCFFFSSCFFFCFRRLHSGKPPSISNHHTSWWHSEREIPTRCRCVDIGSLGLIGAHCLVGNCQFCLVAGGRCSLRRYFFLNFKRSYGKCSIHTQKQ